MTNKLTDNLIFQIQMSFQKDYLRLVSQGKSLNEIYTYLQNKLDYILLYGATDRLHFLDEEEKKKPYALLNSFIRSCPEFRNQAIAKPIFVYNVTVINKITLESQGFGNDTKMTDFFFDWLMLNTLINLSAQSNVRPDYSGHTHSHSDSGSDDKAKLWAVVAVIALLLIAVSLAFIALAYLFKQFTDSMERFWHNEGWMQATVSMLSAAATGTAVGLLTTFFLYAPLATLALAAGFSNPIGLIIVTTICLTLIGAAVGCFLTNVVQNWIIKKSNADALDPKDPHRYSLTASQEEKLNELGLDPNTVKLAIASLREKLGPDGAGSVIGRLFDSERQDLLKQIRELRAGNKHSIEIDVKGHLFRYDLRKSASAPEVEMEEILAGDQVSGVSDTPSSTNDAVYEDAASGNLNFLPPQSSNISTGVGSQYLPGLSSFRQ